MALGGRRRKRAGQDESERKPIGTIPLETPDASCAAAVCFLQLASALSAAEPALVRLAVSEGKDIRFAHLTSKDGLSPGGIRRHPSGRSGILMVQHLGCAEPVRWLSVQILPAGSDPTRTTRRGSLHSCSKGPGWVSLGQHQRISRSVRSPHRNLDPLADRSQRSAQCPRAGLAHQPGSGRDHLAGHPDRPASAGSGERNVPALLSRSG